LTLNLDNQGRKQMLNYAFIAPKAMFIDAADKFGLVLDLLHREASLTPLSCR
jgi:hypothetical protein